MPNKKDTDAETAVVGAIGMLLACLVATSEFFKLLFVGKTKEQIKKISIVLAVITLTILIIFTCLFINASYECKSGNIEHITESIKQNKTK